MEILPVYAIYFHFRSILLNKHALPSITFLKYLHEINDYLNLHWRLLNQPTFFKLETKHIREWRICIISSSQYFLLWEIFSWFLIYYRSIWLIYDFWIETFVFSINITFFKEWFFVSNLLCFPQLNYSGKYYFLL